MPTLSDLQALRAQQRGPTLADLQKLRAANSPGLRPGTTPQNIPLTDGSYNTAPTPGGAYIDQQAAEAKLPQFVQDMSGSERYAAGVGQSVYETARGIKQLGAKIGEKVGLVSPETVSAIDRSIEQSRKMDAPLLSTPGGTAGNITGAVLQSMIPVAPEVSALPRATPFIQAAAQGAAFGGLQPTVGNESRLVNAGAGALGGLVGQGIAAGTAKIAKPIANVLTPTQQKFAQVLEDAGIPLSPADKTGSTVLRNLEAALETVPSTAAKATQKKVAQQAAFNGAILKQLGVKASSASEDVLQVAERRLSNEFNRLTKENAIKVDDALMGDLLSVQDEYGKTLDALKKPVFQNLLNDVLKAGDSGEIGGKTYQATRTRLLRLAKSSRGSDPEFAHAIDGIREALDEGMNRSLPDDAAKTWLRTIRQQYGLLKTLTESGRKVVDEAGDISPANLAGAMRSNNKKAYSYGTGGEAMQIAKAAQAVMVKGKPPNSGTAQRLLYQGLVQGNPVAAAAIAGLGAQQLGADPGTIIGIAGLRYLAPKLIQGAITSKLGKSYLTKGIPVNKQLEKALPILKQLGIAGSIEAGVSSAEK